MKKLVWITLTIISFSTFGQGTAVEHMQSLSSNFDQINKDTWDYIKKASRGRSAGKIEKKRNELALTLRTAIRNVSRVKPYEKDATLKQAYSNYLTLSYHVINDDYRKIVNMEKIAEESYDAMEAYILRKERVNEKMDSAHSSLRKTYGEFALNHNITLTSAEQNRIDRKLNNAGKLNKYYNRIYLIFYKSSWYERELINAMSEGRIGDMEQFRQTLETVSKEGTKELESIEPYQGDKRLKEACFSMLEFFYGEAVRYIPKQIDFYTKKDKMNALSKNIESKNQNQLTKEEVDEYNQAIKDYNTAINEYNSTNDYLNKYRNKRYDQFDEATNEFFTTYL